MQLLFITHEYLLVWLNSRASEKSVVFYLTSYFLDNCRADFILHIISIRISIYITNCIFSTLHKVNKKTNK